MTLLLVNGLPVVYAAPETWAYFNRQLVMLSGGTYAVTGSTTVTRYRRHSDLVTITLDNVSIDVLPRSDKTASTVGKCQTLPHRIRDTPQSSISQPGVRVKMVNSSP